MNTIQEEYIKGKLSIIKVAVNNKQDLDSVISGYNAGFVMGLVAKGVTIDDAYQIVRKCI